MPTSVTSVTSNTLSASNKRGNSTSKKTKYSKCNNKVSDNSLTFHPSISGSMHNEGLPRAIYLLTLVLIPEATLKCRQTYKKTDKVTNTTVRPIPCIGYCKHGLTRKNSSEINVTCYQLASFMVAMINGLTLWNVLKPCLASIVYSKYIKNKCSLDFDVDSCCEQSHGDSDDSGLEECIAI